MTRTEKLRIKIFESYAQNLQKIFIREGWKLGIENAIGKVEELNEFYYCPICGTPFIRDSLNQNVPNPLTLEDVPPQSLGGRKILLTCKNCNNNLGGTKLDSKLIWDMKIKPFLERKPDSQIDAYYNLNERATIKGKLKLIEKGKFQIDFGTIIHSRLRAELEYITNNWGKSKINFRIQTPNPYLVNLALLRISYLIMIAHFGFGYFFNSTSRIIREQLQKPDIKLIPDFGIPSINAFPCPQRGIFINTKPDNLKSFMVVFDLKNNKETRTYCVIIPGPDENCIDIYSELNRIKEFKYDAKLAVESGSFIYKQDPYAYYKLWEANKENAL
jgi:hypothetical protein